VSVVAVMRIVGCAESTLRRRLGVIDAALHGGTGQHSVAERPAAPVATAAGASDRDVLLQEHRYQFELQGFCVIEDVLSHEQLAAINNRIEYQRLPAVRDRIAGRFGSNPGVGSEAAGLLGWGPEFVRLLDHPRLLPYLKFTMDETVVGSHPPIAVEAARGHEDGYGDVRTQFLTGVRLDRVYGIEMTQSIGIGGSFGVHQDHEGTYQFRQGAMRNSLVVATWNLTDSGGDLGGASVCRTQPQSRQRRLTI
jgi:hypothetical protein